MWMTSLTWMRCQSLFHITPTSLMWKEMKTIHARASMTDTKHVTLVATIMAIGKMLPPFLIFKGTQNGWIATWEFSIFLAAGQYACQDKAWMGGARMHEWIATVLKTWKDAWDANNPSFQPSIIILDAYWVHEMCFMVNCIQMMGIEVLHILAGCMHLCQLIDVGINKPINCTSCHSKQATIPTTLAVCPSWKTEAFVMSLLSLEKAMYKTRSNTSCPYCHVCVGCLGQLLNSRDKGWIQNLVTMHFNSKVTVTLFLLI